VVPPRVTAEFSDYRSIMSILLIQSDQHRYDCVGCNGHPFVRTPNLDRIAREGVRFTNAYTPSPLCTPARNCLMFGRWSFQHGVIANPEQTEAPRGPRRAEVAFSRLLAEAGWYLGYVGKWHVSAERDPLDPQFGFADYVPEEAYVRWRAEAGLPSAPSLGALDRRGTWPPSAQLLEYFSGCLDDAIGFEQSRLAWGAERVIEMLGAAAGRPFFLRWDPSEPHLPNQVPEPFASMYAPAELEPWTGFADSLVGKPYVQAQQRRTWGVEGWRWEQWSPIVARYLGEVTLLDSQVGRVLDALDALGLAGHTLVVYTTDHGDMCGSHGMLDKHFVMYDDVVRVPLLMRWPDRLVAGDVHEGFVSSGVDLAVTFLTAAGLSPPPAMTGCDLLGELAGERVARTDALSAYHGNQFGLFSQRMLRTTSHKYVWNLAAEDELYDLEADPGELTNLALDVSRRDVLESLQVRLLERLRELDDPLAGWAGSVQLGEHRTR
jgi:arylsulfatase A-like enzyme